MVEKRKIRAFALALALLWTTGIALGDKCREECSSPGACTPLKCHFLSDVPGRCWYNGKDCVNCKAGDKDVKTCMDYGKDSCEVNPCKIPDGCAWAGTVCSPANPVPMGCISGGCKFSYRCMADGECVHYTVSVQEYCSTAYRRHGLNYDPKNAASCDAVGAVCKEIDKKCGNIIEETLAGTKRRDECISLQRMCLQCYGDCQLQKNIGTVEQVVYGIAAGIAILLTIINGITLATSEDEAARGNAKRSIAYVVLSLAVIVTAVKVVEYLWISFI